MGGARWGELVELDELSEFCDWRELDELWWIGVFGKKISFEQSAICDWGGWPPFFANFFPLTFWPATFRNEGRRGGAPLAESFRDWGF